MQMFGMPYTGYPAPSEMQRMQQFYNSNMSSSQPMSIIKVNGKKEADDYPMPPNSSVLMLDNNDAILYAKFTDAYGRGEAEAYDFTPRKSETEVSISNIEERIKRLEALIYAQSDNCQNEPSCSDAEQGTIVEVEQLSNQQLSNTNGNKGFFQKNKKSY